jgi:23S rRNA G2069 N7-methylase RlmK/C1962 C5-methylase RlmI
MQRQRVFRQLRLALPTPIAHSWMARGLVSSPGGSEYSIVCNSGVSYPTVSVKRGKARLFQDGNPIVFSSAIEKTSSDPAPVAGEEVLVTDHKGTLIGKGAYNPYSLYRVRMLALQTEKDIFHLPFREIVQLRIASAVALRRGCLMLPDAGTTTAYRLINSEGDRISGLVVDVYGCVVVAQCAALWVENCKDTIIKSLKTELGDGICVVWKKSVKFLQLDGLEPSALDLSMDGQEASDVSMEGESIVESGLNYKVFPGRGQKTGFYCDQRMNRLMIRNLCRGNRRFVALTLIANAVYLLSFLI